MAHSDDEKRADERDASSMKIKSPAGRVEIDSRGNSVWRWARSVIDSTSVLLKRLENHDLSLEPTRKVPIARGSKNAADKSKRGAKSLSLEEAKGRDSGGGFDPYNSR
jgi:hypothetical protein